MRLAIWQFALPGPRVVDIAQRKLKKTIGEWEVEKNAKWPCLSGDAAHPFSVNFTEDDEIELPDWSNDEDEVKEESNTNSWADVGSHASMVEMQRRATRSALGTVIGGNKYDEDYYQNANLVGIHSNCEIPNITYVCKESYALVTEKYHAVFSTVYGKSQTLIDLERDTLYLRHDTFSAYFRANGMDSVIRGLKDELGLLDHYYLPKVRNLAILVDEGYAEFNPTWLQDLCRIFTGLDSLTMVLKHFSTDSTTGSSVSLYRPIDADAALAAYASFRAQPLDRSSRMPEIDVMNTAPGYVNISELERLSKEDKEDGTEWKVPRVKVKVAMPDEMWERIDKEEDRCWDFILKGTRGLSLEEKDRTGLGILGEEMDRA